MLKTKLEISTFFALTCITVDVDGSITGFSVSSEVKTIPSLLMFNVFDKLYVPAETTIESFGEAATNAAFIVLHGLAELVQSLEASFPEVATYLVCASNPKLNNVKASAEM